MLCDFFVYIAKLLLTLFVRILPNAPSAYLNMMNYIKNNINNYTSYLFFIDVNYIVTLFIYFIEILIIIYGIFFIMKAVRLIRG